MCRSPCAVRLPSRHHGLSFGDRPCSPCLRRFPMLGSSAAASCRRLRRPSWPSLVALEVARTRHPAEEVAGHRAPPGLAPSNCARVSQAAQWFRRLASASRWKVVWPSVSVGTSTEVSPRLVNRSLRSRRLSRHLCVKRLFCFADKLAKF